MVKTKKPKQKKPKKGKKGASAAGFTGQALVLQPGQKLTDEQIYQYAYERNDTYTELYNLLSYQQDELHAEQVTSQNTHRFVVGVKNVAAREATFHPNLSRTLTNVCGLWDQAESIRREAINRIQRSTQAHYTGAMENKNRISALNDQRLKKFRALQALVQQEKAATTANSPDAVAAGDRRRLAEADYEEDDKGFRNKFWSDQISKREKIKYALQQEVYTRMFYHAKALELMTEAYKLLDDIPTSVDNPDIKEMMTNLNLSPDGSSNPKVMTSKMAAPQEAAHAAAAQATGAIAMPHQQQPQASQYSTGIMGGQWEQ